MKRLSPRFFTALVALTGSLFAQPLLGADGLPKDLAWTAYGTTSTSYAASVAVGNALARAGHKLRVLPANDDIARMTPLKSKKILFSATGVGAFEAQEGVVEFAGKDWGPQPVRLVLMGWGDTSNAAVATAKEANIKSAADLRGKRIAWVVGGRALNHNMRAWLAYGGLSWDDVTQVKVAGWKQSMQGMIDGSIDAAIASTNSSMLFQVDSSARGLHFFPAAADDAQAWERFTAVAPWFVPHTATSGVGISKENPLVGASFGYPVLVAYDWVSDDAVYELVKLMHTRYDEYKNGHSAAAGFGMERQVFQWLMPFHPGAIRYFKEIGVWTDADQAHTEKQLERQSILSEVWERAAPKVDESEKQYEAWMKERAKALKAAGFNPVWES